MPKPKGIKQKPRKPNGDYLATDLVSRLYHEWLIRDFGARTRGVVSTADDCRIEAAILRDALAEIMEARGDHAAASVCREFGPAVAMEMRERKEVASA
jgi:hypothetical protein